MTMIKKSVEVSTEPLDTESHAAQMVDTRFDPDVLREARKIFEVETDMPLGYPGVVFHFFKNSEYDPPLEGETPLDEQELLSMSVDFIRQQLAILSEHVLGGVHGEKHLVDEAATTYHDAVHKDDLHGKLAALPDELERLQASHSVDSTRRSREIENELNELWHQEVLSTYIFYLGIFSSASKNGLNNLTRDLAHNAYRKQQGMDNEDDYYSESDDNIVRALKFAQSNPSSYRHNLLRQLDTIAGEPFDVFAPNIVDTGEETSLPDIDVNFEILANQQLDFTILPGDTNLRELSQELFDESTDTEKERVDLERIKILEDVRQIFGEDKCFFARGKQSGRRYKTESGETIDEDFIVLVMQNHDTNGQVTSEDALAISPISRKHAAFYTRQDASEGISWREIFSLTKRNAQYFGARKLKFVANDDLDPYQAVKEKAFALATCLPGEFNEELRYNTKKKLYETRSSRIRAGFTRSATILGSH
jgi:hypothetical protein